MFPLQKRAHLKCLDLQAQKLYYDNHHIPYLISFLLNSFFLHTFMCTYLIDKAKQLCLKLNKIIIDNFIFTIKQLAKDKNRQLWIKITKQQSSGTTTKPGV